MFLKSDESLHKTKFSFLSIDGMYTNVGHSISHDANLKGFFYVKLNAFFGFKVCYSWTFTMAKLLLEAWSDALR